MEPDQPHPFSRLNETNSCEVCGKQAGDPVHSLGSKILNLSPRIIPGLGTPVTPSETVTRLRRKAGDGRVYLRTGERRQVQPGDYHWCNAIAEAPELVAAPPLLDVFHDQSRFHVCPIWTLDPDQSWEEPEPEPQPEDPLDRLLSRVDSMVEALQDGQVNPLERVAVLAQIHQAKALERIAGALEAMLERARQLPGEEAKTQSPEIADSNTGKHQPMEYDPTPSRSTDPVRSGVESPRL